MTTRSFGVLMGLYGEGCCSLSGFLPRALFLGLVGVHFMMGSCGLARAVASNLRIHGRYSCEDAHSSMAVTYAEMRLLSVVRANAIVTNVVTYNYMNENCARVIYVMRLI